VSQTSRSRFGVLWLTLRAQPRSIGRDELAACPEIWDAQQRVPTLETTPLRLDRGEGRKGEVPKIKNNPHRLAADGHRCKNDPA